MDGDFIKVTAVILFFVALLVVIIRSDVKINNHFSELCSTGFNVDHLLRGSILVAFDDTKRQVAFVGSDGAFRFDYSSIKQWHWQWTENNRGAHVRSWIVFHLFDKENPLMKVRVSRRDAELWDAKIGLILNG